MSSDQTENVQVFYALLEKQRRNVGGYRHLKDASWRTDLPRRGVYFFLDYSEPRETGGIRVVRIGTHAISGRKQKTLPERLENHLGKGGQSVFRRHVKGALASQGQTSDIDKATTSYIAQLPFLWFEVPGSEEREFVETNSIALLSNVGREDPDTPSETWLGKHASNKKVLLSGLWNVKHVGRQYDYSLLDYSRLLVG